MIKKVIFHWRTFGPYHLAQLNAVHQRNSNIEVVGLETASREDTYLWQEKTDITAFLRYTVFPWANEGFNVPMAQWLRGPLQDLLQSMLTSVMLHRHNLLFLAN